MPNPVQALLILLAQATERELARQVQYLKIENRTLRARLPKLVMTTTVDRTRLLKYGRPIGEAINQLITIVVPETFWIQSIQIECLKHFLVLGPSHLDHLVQEFVAHYHAERPHQGIGNQRIITGQPPPDEDVPKLRDIACHERLGGLLKHYQRRAA